VKISDKDLREATVRMVHGQECRKLAFELLQRRREVRRLRAAMRLAVSLMRDPLAKQFPLSYMLDARSVIGAALKPQRGSK